MHKLAFSNWVLCTLFLLINIITSSQSFVVKRQIVFPSDDSDGDTKNVNDRYGSSVGSPGIFNRPFNPNSFGFDNGRNPYNQQFYPQSQPFYPQNLQVGRPNQIARPPTTQNNQFNPQNQQFNPQNQQTNVQNQQQMSTTVSPQVQACIDSCVDNTPGQYIPVCGSDEMTYHNRERFDCAVNCGRNVQIRLLAACPRPTIPAWQKQQVEQSI